MKVIRWFGAIALACLIGAPPAAAQTNAPRAPKPKVSTATKEKAAEEHANPDALVLADFQKRIDAYMSEHLDPIFGYSARAKAKSRPRRTRKQKA